MLAAPLICAAAAVTVPEELMLPTCAMLAAAVPAWF
jgi:hypothetical protein